MSVKKKGGQIRRAHVNRLKFYDPKNSHEDPTVQIQGQDDEEDEQDLAITTDTPPNRSEIIEDQNRRITRRVPPPISRYS